MISALVGASKDAISAHYDLSNDFFSLWLDPSMTYSAALWEEGDDLENAQLRKIDFHLNNLNISQNSHILDIGCGWGGLMRRALERWPSTTISGLTLSSEQYQYLSKSISDQMLVKYESWESHIPEKLYDGIVSVGAFEHFVKPGRSDIEKIQAYRAFFKKCQAITRKGTYLSLQSIVYENYDESTPNEFVKEVFPESDLPRLYQIIKASESHYEVISCRNDRLHYAKTLRNWFMNMTFNREKIRQNHGDEIYKKFIKYLGSFAIGFENGTVNLVRISMKRKNSHEDN